MQIDWLTVAAQIVNFLVLVWLLQRFLYRPITNAMTEREARIEERLSEAASTRDEAEAEKQRLQDKQEDLDASREDILQEARDEAEDLKARLESDIREEMETKRDTWRKHLEDERDNILRDLQKQAGHQVLAIAGRVLEDMADVDMASQVAEIFIARLDALDDERRKKLSNAARQTDDGATVTSGVALPSAARSKITRAIHACLSSDLDVHYREADDLILGVRLTISKETLEWSAAQYLRTLEGTLNEVLDTRHAEKASAEA